LEKSYRSFPEISFWSFAGIIKKLKWKGKNWFKISSSK
jgi:hypothetical protein